MLRPDRTKTASISSFGLSLGPAGFLEGDFQQSLLLLPPYSQVFYKHKLQSLNCSSINANISGIRGIPSGMIWSLRSAKTTKQKFAQVQPFIMCSRSRFIIQNCTLCMLIREPFRTYFSLYYTPYLHLAHIKLSFASMGIYHGIVALECDGDKGNIRYMSNTPDLSQVVCTRRRTESDRDRNRK